MGFGLLLIGYLLANDVIKFSIVPSVIGYALMLWGCLKLSDYNLRFKRCVTPLIPACVLSVYLYCDKIFKYMNIKSVIFDSTAVKIAGLVEALLYAGFLALLMLAIASIAKETELDKVAFKAVRNMLILIASESLYLIAFCLPSGQIANGIAYAVLILRVLRVVLDFMLLFACYRMICSEGDEEMPAKEVKNPILRKMEEVLNKRDKNAYDSARAYKEKRNQKKKKKK